jgi:phosphonoacetaldehyde hydrolase
MGNIYQRSYRGPLRGVIVDWAGTTVDYGSCAPAGVFIDVFEKKGIQVTQAQAREPMGFDKKVHIRSLFQMPDIAQQWQKRFNQSWSEVDVDEMYRNFIPAQIACLKDYSKLIPGTLEAAAEFRKRGLKLGSTTGYSSDMIGIVAAEAKKQGFEPDAIVCSTDVPAGRPDPWMALLAAQKLKIYPLESFVKIGDTIADIEEGLNAGMWTIGLAKTGNELGLSEAEVERLKPAELTLRLGRAYQKLRQAGAHYVVDGISDTIPLLDKINLRLSQGEKP